MFIEVTRIHAPKVAGIAQKTLVNVANILDIEPASVGKHQTTVITMNCTHGNDNDLYYLEVTDSYKEIKEKLILEGIR